MPQGAWQVVQGKGSDRGSWLYHEVFHDSPQPLKLGSMPHQYHSTSLSGFVAGRDPLYTAFRPPLKSPPFCRAGSPTRGGGVTK